VVMTGHAFQALVSDADVRVSLDAVRRALPANGRFAFDTRNPATRAWEDWRPENAVDLTLPDGERVRITTEVTAPFNGDTVTFTHTFTGDNARLPLASYSSLRFFDQQALTERLARAGFRIEAQFGDWDGTPLGEDSPEIITIAVRATAGDALGGMR